MLKLLPYWRKLVGGVLLTLVVGANSSVMAQDMLDPSSYLLPNTLLGMSTNITFGIIIAYMWSADSRRKDDLLKSVMESHREETKALLAQLAQGDE